MVAGMAKVLIPLPRPAAPPAREWRCHNCNRLLGMLTVTADGVLFEVKYFALRGRFRLALGAPLELTCPRCQWPNARDPAPPADTSRV